MNRNKLIGIAVIGGGLVWYMNSQSSTLPAVTTTTSTIANTDGSTTTTNDDGSTTTTNTDGSTTTTDADGTVIETTETPEIDTTEGSDDANTTADCSKYRASQHEKEKVWMNKKTLVIMDQDDIDEFKQLLDLIYTELNEFNTVVKEKLDDLEDEEGNAS